MPIFSRLATDSGMVWEGMLVVLPVPTCAAIILALEGAPGELLCLCGKAVDFTQAVSGLDDPLVFALGNAPSVGTVARGRVGIESLNQIVSGHVSLHSLGLYSSGRASRADQACAWFRPIELPSSECGNSRPRRSRTCRHSAPR